MLVNWNDFKYGLFVMSLNPRQIKILMSQWLEHSNIRKPSSCMGWFDSGKWEKGIFNYILQRNSSSKAYKSECVSIAVSWISSKAQCYKNAINSQTPVSSRLCLIPQNQRRGHFWFQITWIDHRIWCCCALINYLDYSNSITIA